MKSGWQKYLVQFNVCVLSALLVFVQTTVLADPVSSQAPAAAGKADLQQILDNLNRAFDALEAAQKEIPRDSFDTEAALELAGLDVKDVFHWVRDNTYFVPYQGALRGATGVLMDRTGNSLDRALLLNELLRLLGYQTRLAWAQLTPAQVEDLQGRVRPVPPAGPVPAVPPADDPDKEIARYADTFGLDLKQLKAQAEEATREQKSLQELSANRVAELSAFLLGKISPPPETALTEQQAQIRNSLQDHWWLQYQDGANWISLDPTLPDAEAGQTFAEPAETRFVSSLNNLDENRLHSVRIKVVLECWYEGGLHEETLLESPRLHPSELLGQALTLQHVPVNWPGDLNLFTAQNSQELIKTNVLAQDAWAPALKIGARTLFDRSWNTTCELGDAFRALNAAGKLGSAVGNKLEKFDDELGSADQAGAGNGPARNGLVTAQWIDYEISVPGEPSRTVRRQVFDLIGAAERLAGPRQTPAVTEAQNLSWRLALLGQTEIMLLGSSVSPEFGEATAIRTVTERRQYLTAFLHSIASGQENKLIDVMQNVPPPPPSELYALAMARTIWNDAPGLVYLDKVNILSRHTQYQWAADSRIGQLEAFDIVANDVATGLSSSAAAFSATLKHGVLDTDAETLLATGSCPDPGQASSCRQQGSAAAVYFASKTQGINWVAVKAEQELAESADGFEPDTRARIQQDLSNGYVVLVPATAVNMDGRSVVAWWRVSPLTGQTLGMVGNGWGSEGVSWLGSLNVAFRAYSAYMCFEEIFELSPGAIFSCGSAIGGFGKGASLKEVLFHGGLKGSLFHFVFLYVDFALSAGMPGFKGGDEEGKHEE